MAEVNMGSSRGKKDPAKLGAMGDKTPRVRRATTRPATPDLSGERFRVALAAAPIVVFNQDCDLRYTWIGNPSLGLKAEEALGRTDEEIVGAATARPLTAIKRRVLETGQGERQEVTVMRAGQSATYDLTVEPLREKSGRVFGLTCVALDITARKQAEVVSRESEQRFKALIEKSPLAIGITRFADGRFLEANDAFVRFYGYSREELVGHTAQELRMWHSGSRAALVRKLRRGEGPQVVEVKVRCKGGEVRDVLASFDRLVLGGEPCLVGFLTDLTERKRMESSLRESEERFRALVEKAPEGIFVQTKQRYAYVNPAFLRILGASRPEQLLGQPIENRMHPDFRAQVRERIRRLNEQQQPVEAMDQVHLRLDGTRCEVTVSAVPINFQGEQGALVFVRDITARRRLEAERAVALERLARVEEQERLRLARELHDQTAQRLVALAVELKNLETALAAGRSPAGRMRSLRRSVDELQLQVRQMAWGLRSGEAVEGGLEHGLREYVEEWSERVGVPVDCEYRGLVAGRLPLLLEATLYRVAQEALANVEKHARARRVSVLVEVGDALVRLTVDDDGRGFDVDAAAVAPEAGQRLGLLGMRERVGLAGGTLVIESSPGKGTTVLVRIPLQARIER